MSALCLPLARDEARRIVGSVDGRDAYAIPGGVRVMAKLARRAQGDTANLTVTVDELELVCEFAHESPCELQTTLNLVAVLQEHRP